MLIFNGGGERDRDILSTKSSISSKFPLYFSTFSLGASDFLGNGPMILDDMVLVLGLI